MRFPDLVQISAMQKTVTILFKMNYIYTFGAKRAIGAIRASVWGKGMRRNRDLDS